MIEMKNLGFKIQRCCFNWTSHLKLLQEKGADEGIVEVKIRKTGETLEVSESEVVAKIKELMKLY